MQNTPPAGDDNHRSLSGAGAGLDWQPAPELSFSVAAAARTGESALSDRDERVRVRVWGGMRWKF